MQFCTDPVLGFINFANEKDCGLTVLRLYLFKLPFEILEFLYVQSLKGHVLLFDAVFKILFLPIALKLVPADFGPLVQ